MRGEGLPWQGQASGGGGRGERQAVEGGRRCRVGGRRREGVRVREREGVGVLESGG